MKVKEWRGNNTHHCQSGYLKMSTKVKRTSHQLVSVLEACVGEMPLSCHRRICELFLGISIEREDHRELSDELFGGDEKVYPPGMFPGAIDEAILKGLNQRVIRTIERKEAEWFHHYDPDKFCFYTTMFRGNDTCHPLALLPCTVRRFFQLDEFVFQMSTVDFLEAKRLDSLCVEATTTKVTEEEDISVMQRRYLSSDCKNGGKVGCQCARELIFSPECYLSFPLISPYLRLDRQCEARASYQNAQRRDDYLMSMMDPQEPHLRFVHIPIGRADGGHLVLSIRVKLCVNSFCSLFNVTKTADRALYNRMILNHFNNKEEMIDSTWEEIGVPRLSKEELDEIGPRPMPNQTTISDDVFGFPFVGIAAGHVQQVWKSRVPLKPLVSGSIAIKQDEQAEGIHQTKVVRKVTLETVDRNSEVLTQKQKETCKVVVVTLDHDDLGIHEYWIDLDYFARWSLARACSIRQRIKRWHRAKSGEFTELEVKASQTEIRKWLCLQAGVLMCKRIGSDGARVGDSVSKIRRILPNENCLRDFIKYGDEDHQLLGLPFTWLQVRLAIADLLTVADILVADNTSDVENVARSLFLVSIFTQGLASAYFETFGRSLAVTDLTGTKSAMKTDEELYWSIVIMGHPQPVSQRELSATHTCKNESTDECLDFYKKLYLSKGLMPPFDHPMRQIILEHAGVNMDDCRYQSMYENLLELPVQVQHATMSVPPYLLGNTTAQDAMSEIGHDEGEVIPRQRWRGFEDKSTVLEDGSDTIQWTWNYDCRSQEGEEEEESNRYHGSVEEVADSRVGGSVSSVNLEQSEEEASDDHSEGTTTMSSSLEEEEEYDPAFDDPVFRECTEEQIWYHAQRIMRETGWKRVRATYFLGRQYGWHTHVFAVRPGRISRSGKYRLAVDIFETEDSEREYVMKQLHHRGIRWEKNVPDSDSETSETTCGIIRIDQLRLPLCRCDIKIVILPCLSRRIIKEDLDVVGLQEYVHRRLYGTQKEAISTDGYACAGTEQVEETHKGTGKVQDSDSDSNDDSLPIASWVRKLKRKKVLIAANRKRKLECESPKGLDRHDRKEQMVADYGSSGYYGKNGNYYPDERTVSGLRRSLFQSSLE